MSQVLRKISENRLDITLSGNYSLRDLELLGLSMLREAAGLQFGFGVCVNARNLRMEDPSMAPILAKVFRSLQWFGISYIQHQGMAQHLDSQVRTLYGLAGLLGSVPLEIEALQFGEDLQLRGV